MNVLQIFFISLHATSQCLCAEMKEMLNKWVSSSEILVVNCDFDSLGPCVVIFVDIPLQRVA